ncbi:phycobilisome rod-core linker polypeptide [Candidatus Cyanaurora vandensis]|uniref:phycobilisome rod-core linker polypeptide n=1 Tax=Candidatus Cyanaurora vandensis TaxID=2714958 RepID=UPI00257ED242|nr:phycobilisome rod-core linker polypeptide [Candidatus Cyanaurora vandensis]
MQPIILRNTNARRPIQGRPNLDSYNKDLQTWSAASQTQYALEKARLMSTPALRGANIGTVPGGLLGRRAGGQSQPERRYRWTLLQTKAQKEALLGAIYRQVLERALPEGSRLNEEESRLTNGEITVREFIRILASSDLWVQQFFVKYPNIKVVEKLFKHLLGRAPSNQEEIIKYHGLLSKKGLKGIVDALMTSNEYTEVFGDDLVPFPRYKSDPQRGLDTRAYLGSLQINSQQTFQNNKVNFPSFGPGSWTGNEQKPLLRVQEQIFAVGKGASVDQVIRAAYRQVLEKEPTEIQRLSEAESRFRNGEWTVKELVRALGFSELYLKLYLARWDNCKVAEFNYKHFLGRQPSSARELREHTNILGQKGRRAAVDALLNSEEYTINFGDDTVPYYRLQSERYAGTVDAPTLTYLRSRTQVRVALLKSTVPAYSTL